MCLAKTAKKSTFLVCFFGEIPAECWHQIYAEASDSFSLFFPVHRVAKKSWILPLSFPCDDGQI